MVRVSIITPFLNGAEFFDEAIRSAFAQTFESYELVLVDDGSTDGSSEKAQEYVKLYPNKIRYFHHFNRMNLGQGPSRNLGIEKAKGDLIAFLDIDDVWLPTKLEKQVKIFDQLTSVGMTYCPYFIWHSWSQEVGANDVRGEIAEGNFYDRILLPPSLMLYFIETGNGLPTPCSAVVRKSILQKLGGFEAEFPGMYDDEALFSKILLDYPIYILSENLDKYRQHRNSYCEKAIRDGLWVRDPNVLTHDKARLLRWLHSYIAEKARCSSNDKISLQQSLDRKMNAFGMHL